MDGHTSVESTVIDFCKDALGVNVSPGDISIAHRMKAGNRDSVRPIIVRFAKNRVRNLVYNSKKLPKNHSSRVFISEHLTKTASDFFYDARNLLCDKKVLVPGRRTGKFLSGFCQIRV